MIMTLNESNSELLPTVSSALAWSQIRSLVLDGVTSPHTKRTYGAAVDKFLQWYVRDQPGPLSKAVLQRYKASVLEGRGLAASSINTHLAALRKLAAEAADNGLVDAEVARAIGKVKGAKARGVRLGNWLSSEQAQALLDMPDRTTLRGLRDVALLAVLLGAGLRRAEAAALRIDHIQQREGRWVIVDLLGKGGRVRSVPIAAWVKAAIDRWLNAAGIREGYVLRSVNKGSHVSGERMTAAGVYAALKPTPSWRRTICGARLRNWRANRAARSSKFSCRWGTRAWRRPSGTSGRSKISRMRPAIGSACGREISATQSRITQTCFRAAVFAREALSALPS